MRLQIIVVIAMMLNVSSAVFAQDEMYEDGEKRGYLMVGGSTIDLDGLNARFQDKGYPEVSDELFNIGVGVFQKVSPRFMIGGEGQLLIGEQNSSYVGGSRYSSSILGGYGLINTGYLVYESRHLDIFPILGMGVGGVGVKLGQSSFGDILDNPHRSASLTSFSFLVNVGLETDFKMKVPGSKNDDSFLFVGLRGGYLFSPVNGGWYSDDMRLLNDPDGGFEGPYFRITFGGGGGIIKNMFDDKSCKKNSKKNALGLGNAVKMPGLLAALYR